MGGVSRRAAQFGLGAAVAVLLLCLSILIAGGTDSGLGDALAGTPARNFHLRDLNNHLISLTDLRGKVVGVYFAGDIPKPEVRPQIIALQKAYGDDARVKVLAVYNDDLSSDSTRQALSDVAEHEHLATLTDPTAEVSKEYKVGQTPTLFVIDQHGIIRLRQALDDSNAGLMDDFHHTIDSLLDVKPSLPSLAQNVLSNVK